MPASRSDRRFLCSGELCKHVRLIDLESVAVLRRILVDENASLSQVASGGLSGVLSGQFAIVPHDIVEVRGGTKNQSHTLCHYPTLTWNHARRDTLMMLGHVHDNWPNYGTASTPGWTCGTSSRSHSRTSRRGAWRSPAARTGRPWSRHVASRRTTTRPARGTSILK